MDFLGVKYHLPPPHSTPPPHAHLPGARALKMNFWETEKVDMQYPPQAAAFFAEGCRVFMGCRHPCINWPAVQAWHHGHSTDKESKMAPSAPVHTIQAGISNSAFFPQVKGVQILCMCNCFIYFWKCMCFWASSSLKRRKTTRTHEHSEFSEGKTRQQGLRRFAKCVWWQALQLPVHMRNGIDYEVVTASLISKDDRPAPAFRRRH